MLKLEGDGYNSLSFGNHRDSLFYARCKNEIIIWKSSTEFRMRNNVPQPGLMRANSNFHELEEQLLPMS
jgi:hypothetical protein